VRSQALIVTATTFLWLAAISGCRTPGGTLSFVPGARFREPTPTRPSGTETRAAFVLGNGVRVILEENHATSAVAIQAWIDAGAVHDPVDKPGAAYLLEDLILGSPRLGAFADLGGEISGWASHDEVVYRATVAGTFAGASLGALSEALGRPDWSPESLASARRTATTGARLAATAPGRDVAVLALALAFGPGPYARPVVPTSEQLMALSAADLRALHAQLYVGPRVNLVVVGDFDTAELRASLEGTFGAWPTTAPPSATSGTGAIQVPDPIALGPPGGGPRLTVVTGDVAEPEVAVAFRTPATRHDDVPALELLAAIVGRAQVGRLQVDVAQNRQLANVAGAYLFSSRQAGLLVAHATLAPGPIDDAVAAMIDAVFRLASERVERDELERARVAVEGEDAARRASLDGYAARLGWFASRTGQAGHERGYRERLRTLDARELQSVASHYLRASNMVVTVVLPGAPAAGAAPPGRDEAATSAVMARLGRVLAACEQKAPAPRPTGRASATAVGQDYVEYRLTSGVRLLVIPDDTATQVAVRALWSGGARTEDARLGGASALLARLLPLGTRSRRTEPMAAEMAEIAGSASGIAGADVFGLRADFLATRWERGLELVVDVLRNPRFAEEDVERERRVQLDLLRDESSDPAAVALRTFRETLYGAHPYRRDPLGTPQSVSALTRRRLLDHFRRSYRPASLTMAIVGAVVPSEVATKVQGLFADLAPAPPAELPPLANVSGPAAPVVVTPSPSPAPAPAGPTPAGEAHLMLGYLGLTVQDPDRLAFDVLVELLRGPGHSGGEPGRLSAVASTARAAGRPVVLAREAVDGGFFAVSAPVAADASIEAVVAALRLALADLTAREPTAEEVARARQLLVGRSALAFERRGAVAMALALHGALGENVSSYRRDGEALARVGPSDVLRVARRVIDPRREVLVIVRPPPPDPAVGRREREDGRGLQVSPVVFRAAGRDVREARPPGR
jgi:zinc protease